MEENHIKVVFIGESEVGKTSLINRYVTGDFSDYYYTTSASYSSKTIENEGTKYYFDIWDTSGYEKYRALTKFFIAEAKIIVLVYDITKKRSFLELDYWLDTILNILGPKVFLILVGNKSDLYENEEVREQDAKKFAQIIKAKFVLVSAKTDDLHWNDFFENALRDYIKFMKN